MGGNSVRRAINFDLDTNFLKEYYCQETGKDYTKAYYDIRKFMAESGFIHRQGSGYVSSAPLNDTEITRFVMQITKTLPWLSYCASKIDLTNVEEKQSLLDDIIKYSNQTPDQIKDQYFVGEYFDGSAIIDTESLDRDHPEMSVYEEQQEPWAHENTQEERPDEINNSYDEWELDR